MLRRAKTSLASNNMFVTFFSLNYLSFALIFILQVLTVRFFGETQYGQYAVYLALMAILEGPIISARSENSLSVLNVSRNKKSLLMVAVKKDFCSSFYLLMPVVLIVTFVFDFFTGCLAWLTIVVQSGYSVCKSYFEHVA